MQSVKSKQIRGGTALLIVIMTICALLTGCGGEGKISAPFSDYECKGKNVAEITAQLEEAGFTNIQTEPQEVSTEFNADQVISVKIGSNTTWNEANAWKPDVQITVTYYEYTGIRHIEVTADIVISGEDGKPIFTVQTNLPDGTVLGAELSYDGELTAGHEDYVETQDITVQDGVAQTEAFTKGGEALTGKYRFIIAMLPTEQTESVQEVIGASGEALTGSLVVTLDSYKYIAAEKEYESPVAESTPEIEKISEEELETRLREALSGFGDDCEISAEEYLYTVNVWQDGLATTAFLAAAGDAEALEAWNSVADVTRSASESLQLLLEQSGYGDYMVVINVLNDENKDNVLLSAMWGMITDNCAS